MDSATWKDLYGGDVQGVYALIVVPVLFLIYRLGRGSPGRAGVLPAAAPFVDAYAVLFAIETILDPLATGPLARWLGIADASGGTALLIAFVLLGDLRVYLLVFGLQAIAAGRSWTTALGRAAVWTALVPVVAFTSNALLHAVWPDLGDGSIWIVYEALFTGVALWLRARLAPAIAPTVQPALRRYLRAMLAYVAAYYVLWLWADLLIQIGGLDAGWLLRIVPNQLYYALWVPVVFFAFFSARYASTSASTQAAR